MKQSAESHDSRKALFALGIRRGSLTVEEIERALPPGTLSPAERWLLLFSLRAAGVEIRKPGGVDAAGPERSRGGRAPRP